MRIKFAKFVAFFIVFVNIIVVYFTLKLFLSFSSGNVPNTPAVIVKKNSVAKPTLKHFHKFVSIVIREFELHDNDVTQTVKSFISIFPNVQVYIICDILPYPPLELTFWNNSIKNVKVISLAPNLRLAFIEQYPLVYIKTKYVLFVPDSTRLVNRQGLQSLLSELTKNPEIAVAAAIGYKTNLNCLTVNASSKTWSLKYESNQDINGLCDTVVGKHVAMLETDLLKRLPNAFLLPFPQALYLQTAALGVKIKLIKEPILTDGKPVLKSHHTQWKKQQVEIERRKLLYNFFKFKQVILENGAIEWYGCSRDTPRCFPPVVDSMPSYLYENRWTPPCCLANLRRTAKHVFNCLDDAGVRYWLENGSLLGAMRSTDILPWDHDVDIGMYRDDVKKSMWLEKARNKPTIDSKGFVWEKATEGNFFRVHFSKINRIHVNIFPFLLKNGTMVRDGWFTSHKNMEFSDRFLHPMSSIEFLGRHVPCPNNIRDFLEIKYGKGAVEHPKYPDPVKLKYP